jgi:hypothetical protein
MKLTKSILVAALVVGGLFAGNNSLFAQPAVGPGAGARAPMTADARLTAFETALGSTNKLSDEQIPKVKAVFEDMITKQTALRADTTVAQADRATKRTAIMTEASDKLKTILTPAQFTVYQAMPQRGGRRGGAGGAAPATPPPAPAN